MIPYPQPRLTHDQVEVRRWSMADLPLVEEAARDPLLLPGTTLPSRYTPEEGTAFIERQLSRQRSGDGLSLCITHEGAPVGCTTLIAREPRVPTLGYWLVQRARRSGIGTHAVSLLVDWALSLPAVDAIQAFVAEDNLPSRKLLERIGFHDVGLQHHAINDLDGEFVVYLRNPSS